MRLLYVNADPGVPVLGHKGASIHVRELSRALIGAGADLVIAAPRIDPEVEVAPLAADLVAIPGVLPKKRTERDVLAAVEVQTSALAAVADVARPDAIYERFSLFSVAGARIARRRGIPYVLEVNAPLRQEAERFRVLPHPMLAESLEREVLAAAGQVFVVSAPLRDHVVAHGADPARVHVVPNGVDADAPVRSTRADGRFVVGFAGSLKAWHGVEILLAACALAAETVDGLVLDVVGHGPLDDRLVPGAAGTAELRCPGALPHEQTRARIATWDVGTAPYLPVDGFWFSPLKVLEYMAAAVCPVASALGELPALLDDGVRGVTVPPGDADALAAALVALAGDRERVDALGARGRRHVVEHRSWAAIAGRVLTAAGADVEAAA